jgi:hypothetical protein
MQAKRMTTAGVVHKTLGLGIAAVCTLSAATLALALSNVAEPQSGMAAPPISQAPPMPPPSTRGSTIGSPNG